MRIDLSFLCIIGKAQVMKRRLVGFDIETFFIVNQVAPEPVCVSLYVDGKRELYKAREGAAR